jgi:hypothetical protein
MMLFWWKSADDKGGCAEADVKFADDEIDVPTLRGQCSLAKRGNANAGYLTGEEMLDVEGVGVWWRVRCRADDRPSDKLFGLDGVCVFVNRVWIISKGERSGEEEGGCKYEREIDEYFGVPSLSSPGLEYWLSTGS